MKIKKCPGCGKELPWTKEFFNSHRRPNHPNALSYYCKVCSSAYCTAWNKKPENRIRANDIKRRNKFKTKYKISEKEIQELMNKSMGCCSICNESLITPESRISYHVDHDHKTDKVRGLLCGSCNRGLGQFRDSIEVLKNAIKYLQEFR